MKTLFTPIIEIKTDDCSDKNNYRPIALVIEASELFVIFVLKILEMYLVTHGQQFSL